MEEMNPEAEAPTKKDQDWFDRRLKRCDAAIALYNSIALCNLAVEYASDCEEDGGTPDQRTARRAEKMRLDAAAARITKMIISDPEDKKALEDGILEDLGGVWYNKETGLYTCGLCGNTWDGNAQCYPCVY